MRGGQAMMMVFYINEKSDKKIKQQIWKNSIWPQNNLSKEYGSGLRFA